MRMIIIAISATLILGAGCNQNEEVAADQSAPAVEVPSAPTFDAPANEAVDTTDNVEPGAPVAGANSFTEDQAAARIAERGYTNVTDLLKGEDGIWRGKAQREGQTVDVTLDFEGNVTP